MGELFESVLDQAFVGQRGLIGGHAGFNDGGGGLGEADLNLVGRFAQDQTEARVLVGQAELLVESGTRRVTRCGSRSCSSRVAQ